MKYGRKTNKNILKLNINPTLWGRTDQNNNLFPYIYKQTKIKLFCWNLTNNELMHGLHVFVDVMTGDLSEFLLGFFLRPTREFFTHIETSPLPVRASGF